MLIWKPTKMPVYHPRKDDAPGMKILYWKLHWMSDDGYIFVVKSTYMHGIILCTYECLDESSSIKHVIEKDLNYHILRESRELNLIKVSL